MYVRIANESGDVNRLFLEKLGISTKRDNEDTIGQFGSGSKFAPIAALRRNWSWLNAGNDADGAYRMNYEIEESDDISEVFFVYNNGTRKPSSYTAEAGVLSWEDSFQIVREALANAIDEFVENGSRWWWELVDEPLDEDGIFSVFIRDEETWNPPPEVMNVLENFDEYFSINREKVFSTSIASIFDRSNSPDGLIFHKGVRVHEFCEEDFGPMIWDYQFNSITLNEERRVRDAHVLGAKVGDIISAFDTPELVEKYLSADQRCYEKMQVSGYSMYPEHKELWLSVWSDLEGDKAIPVSDPVPKFVATRLKIKGYHAVQVPYVVQCALERAGVDTIHDVLSGEDTFDTRKMTETDEARLDEALTMIERAGVTVDKRVVSFFDPIDESQEQLWGAVRDRRIFINYELCAPGKLNALVGTLIHENDHIQSGLHDDEEEFRHIADDLIGRLIIENYR